MNYQKSRLAIGVMTVSALVPVLWACGPWFPNWLLNDGDRAILRAPLVLFHRQIVRLNEAKEAGFKTLPPTKGHAVQTMDGAMKDLKMALADQSISVDMQRSILSGHEISRQKIAKYRKAREVWEKGTPPWIDEPVDPAPLFNVPLVVKGLPIEFNLYFRGSIAYYRGATETARKYWEQVLTLPEKSRQYRSTWAAFMLGKLDLESDPSRSALRFQEVRELTALGFVDRIGLSASSYGWEAKASLNQKDFVHAIELYLDHLSTGEQGTSLTSIRWAVDAAFDEGGDVLKAMAQVPKVREVATVYLVSSSSLMRWGRGPQLDSEIQRLYDWVRAIENAGIVESELLEYLALAAYQRGLDRLAARYLERCPEDSLTASWLRAKLLFKSGDIDKATAALSKVVQALALHDSSITQAAHNDSESLMENLVTFDDDGTYYRRPGKQHAQAELAVLKLQRRDYVETLDALLRSGYWMDGAYIAERVLTIEELVDYVDLEWPLAPTNSKKGELRLSEIHWYWWGSGVPEDRILSRIRFLLARRLARDKRGDEAGKYYPEKWRILNDQRRVQMAIGNDGTRSEVDRADALWNVAKTTRYSGMELFGTELDPDWTVHGGSFTDGVTLEWRQSPKNKTILRPTDEEVKRVNRTRVSPFKRYHYRFLAADIAWEALKLMPDDTMETAKVFCEAGAWIKRLDPQAADRFYKALVNRCGNTRIGRVADQQRWFPKFDQNGKLIVPPPIQLSIDPD
ncbi:MAG TPA: hypothetical protein EYQ50_13620 [Verrucomicrobiales bacterium]|nr:hypothetical protein [Verrucomicrobiales bacterium]